MAKKLNISDKDKSILVTIKSLANKLADEKTHDPLWLGIAFGYVYAIITQTDPQNHELHVADVVLDMFENASLDIENRYNLDIIEELHKVNK